MRILLDIKFNFHNRYFSEPKNCRLTFWKETTLIYILFCFKKILLGFKIEYKKLLVHFCYISLFCSILFLLTTQQILVSIFLIICVFQTFLCVRKQNKSPNFLESMLVLSLCKDQRLFYNSTLNSRSTKQLASLHLTSFCTYAYSIIYGYWLIDNVK